MIDLKGINLGNARSVYMTANTPMYIVRNLRSDPEIVKLHLKNSADTILAEIKERLERLPLDFEDRILPLVLLIALALKQNRTAMMEAACLDGKSYRWYKPVADSLVQQVRPTSVSTIVAPVTVTVKPAAPTQSASSYRVIELAAS
ncbi:hypothetical protein [Novosphingobium sp. AAP93]|uniref:hypothetical protein n=1 Tax=Novosphingobium sp. AAP93 TaxID=1523427 RepID=UPI0006B8DFBD|nr:hypothetical protein [Novosphingobium sp. AAP93]KPF81419.1 hypothetical protein IP83_13325 [Novosphingobium sp. AAP93]